ncbi:MAG: hypothetical protein AMJ90_05955 [candidate division Zixibacteria bacterium SM23_73_2]|nr:MAG: hypothetical protein AMJ90_05955 [candidate division Zixibacteria bacterium SM23_73_2]
MARQALGKGIEALIPKETPEVLEGKRNLAEIAIERIKPNPYQPRESFDEKSLHDLAESIKEKGIIQPVVVRKKEDGFELVAGERRLKAARSIGQKLIPAIIMEKLSKQSMLELTLIENVQREDLNPIEEANGYKRLLEECGLTQTDLSKRVGKDRASISNTLRLLNLPEEVKKLILSRQISEGHARAILALSMPYEQIGLANKIKDLSLSVREAEQIAYGKSKRKSKRAEIHQVSLELKELEEKLQRFFGTKVRIMKRKRKGKIEIDFFSEQELDRILELLNL